jgi:hypothetical protein
MEELKHVRVGGTPAMHPGKPKREAALHGRKGPGPGDGSASVVQEKGEFSCFGASFPGNEPVVDPANAPSALVQSDESKDFPSVPACSSRDAGRTTL